MNNLTNHLTTIAAEIEQAESHLADLEQWIERVEAAGMYCAVPAEEWKNDKYLYMRFPPGDERDGLDAKGRLYIGCKPDRITEARRLTANRDLYEKLESIAGRLRRWLRGEEQAIKYRAHQATSWPRYHQQLSFELYPEANQ